MRWLMTTIYFVRHAEPNYDHRDDFSRELTPKGVAQSENLIYVFKDIDIDLFFSSPYKRAVDTIYPLAKHRQKDIEINDDFRERKIGKWVDDFDEFSQRQWQDFDYHLTNGESLNDVQKRNIVALQTLLNTHPKKTVVIGTHGTALSTIMNYYYPNFGFDDFYANKRKLPWIMVLEFDGLALKNSHELVIDGHSS